MEPTGFFKAAPSLESTSLPTESFMKSAARKPATTNAPEQDDPKPFKASAMRSRDASVSSIRPNHDDMILPAVARRIKEQGLHEHDVIAYSDAYDAPLYKLPSSPAYENNPFASYDRAKAVSSASLAQQKAPEDSTATVSKNENKDNGTGAENDSEIVQKDAGKGNRRRAKTGPPVPEATARASIEVPSSAESPSERASRAQRGGISRSSSRRQRRQQQEQHEQNEERRQQEQYEQYEQHRQQEQQEHHEQFRQHQQQNAHDPTSAQELRPERPRRARRNTNRQSQPDSPAYGEEPMPRQERRPNMQENQDKAAMNGSDSLYQQQSHYQGHFGHHGAQKEWNDPHDPYSRQQRHVTPPESWDRRHPVNDDTAQQSPHAYQQNGNMRNGHDMAQYGAQGEMSRHNQRHYAGDQLQGHPSHRDAHNDYRHQQGYSQEQGGYRHQQQDKFQGNASSQHAYQTQRPDASRPSYPQSEMVQVEMSQLDSSLENAGQQGAERKSNLSQENIKKKKEALCCIIC
ncbi:hypothetical protein BGZ68_007039 [Mortierella alpina]|nr:hypothetical protein BGZ68_007039 [Mortierella alpina]